jgi:RNA polymerase sigma-70 factor (ECF subfamily)
VARHSSMSELELIRACAESNDGDAWSEFVSRFQRPISLSIMRTADQWGHPPHNVVDDLVQETYLKLCADKCHLLLEFALRQPGAIGGYIKTIAVNVTHDHFKALHSQKRGSGDVAHSIDDHVEITARQGSLGGQPAMDQEVLLSQINACLTSCSEGPDRERDCFIFWLYYQQGMTAKAIAALPTVGLSAKGVESAILRLTRLVRERVVGLRSEPLANTTQDGKGFHTAESY